MRSFPLREDALQPVDREELRHLLSVSGTMAGLCITAVTLIATIGRASGVAATIVDEIFVICGVLFLLCTYFVFWALRTGRPELAAQLDRVAAMLFAIALTGMVSAGILMVFTVT